MQKYVKKGEYSKFRGRGATKTSMNSLPGVTIVHTSLHRM